MYHLIFQNIYYDFLDFFLAIFQGVGRRYANLVCKKADVDLSKRAGELTEEEVVL